MFTTGPLPISIFDSKTIPLALVSYSVFKSKSSACKITDSTKNHSDFKNYLERLNLEQLRTMSKEFIL